VAKAQGTKDKTMTIRVLDPSNERHVAQARLAERAVSLRGKTVGFISNGKEGTKGYFRHLERMLREDLGIADVVWRTKSNYSAPAEAAIVDEIRKWQAVVAGVGD
jgi:hypothetical protein